MQKEAINQKHNLSDVKPYIVSEVNGGSMRPKSGVGCVDSREDIVEMKVDSGLEVSKGFKEPNDGPSVVDMTNFTQVIDDRPGFVVKEDRKSVV